MAEASTTVFWRKMSDEHPVLASNHARVTVLSSPVCTGRVPPHPGDSTHPCTTNLTREAPTVAVVGACCRGKVVCGTVEPLRAASFGLMEVTARVTPATIFDQDTASTTKTLRREARINTTEKTASAINTYSPAPTQQYGAGSGPLQLLSKFLDSAIRRTWGRSTKAAQ